MLLCVGRSHLVQSTVESTAPSSSDVQQSVFASIDSVAAFSAAAAQEQQHSRFQLPGFAELQASSPSTAKMTVASKKKLMSMAFQAQKQRRELAAAATAAAAAAAAVTETGSNADTEFASSDNDTSSASERENQDIASDNKQSATDDHESLVPDDTDAARSAVAVSVPPKTLTPAKTQSASLVVTPTDPDGHCHSIDVLSSPIKLVPPADPQHIHAVVATDMANVTTDAETVQQVTDFTEEH